jgi:hypothetical protein
MPDRIILRNNLIIPADLVEDLIVQSGWTRDQLRWGFDLGLHWDMTSTVELMRLINDQDILSLVEILAYIGAGDIYTEEDYRESLETD